MNHSAALAPSESGRKMKSWQTLALLSVICVLTAAIINLFADSSIPAWYADLRKPGFSPPNWLFASVWTLLYGCMALAAWLIYRMPPCRLRIRALMLFAIQFLLNVLWTMDFFYFHVLGPALFLIVLLWVAILWTTVRFWQLKPATAYLMGPYLAWVTFASTLNLEIAIFN